MAAAYTERCYFYSAISLAIGARGGGPQTKAGEPARGGVPAHLHAGSTAADRPEVESAAPRRGGKGLLCHGARPGAPGDSGSGCLHPLEVGRCLRGLTHGPHRKRPGRPMTIWSRRAPSPTPEHNLPVDRPAPDPRAQLAHRVTSQCVPAWIASPRLPDSPLPVSRRPPRRHRPGATRWGPALRSLRALSAPHRTPAEQCGLGPLITQLLPAPAYMPTTVTPPPTRPTRNADQPSTDLSPSGRSLSSPAHCRSPPRRLPPRSPTTEQPTLGCCLRRRLLALVEHRHSRPSPLGSSTKPHLWAADSSQQHSGILRAGQALATVGLGCTLRVPPSRPGAAHRA